jgi:O-antigen/teichoic acid export membrane protein
VTRTAVLILLGTFVLNPLPGLAQAFAVAGQRMYLAALAGVLGRITSVLLVALFAALDAGPLAIAAAYAAANVMADLVTVVLLRGKLRFALRIDRRQVRSLVAAAVPLAWCWSSTGCTSSSMPSSSPCWRPRRSSRFTGWPTRSSRCCCPCLGT